MGKILAKFIENRARKREKDAHGKKCRFDVFTVVLFVFNGFHLREGKRGGFT
jgi:hypothetical protein